MNKKYFQTLLQRENKEKEIYCNILVLFYKEIPVTSLYVDDIDKNIINMSAATRKKYAWDNYSFLIKEMREDIINDDINYPVQMLSRKELYLAL